MGSSPDIRMVDVGEKAVTKRQAVAKGRVLMQAKTLKLLKQGKLPKGDVLAASRVAGIMAAKETYRLIPLCHPLLIDDVEVEFTVDEKASAVEIMAMVKGSGKTGFEMEALTAVAVSGLTVYDMCKIVDQRLRLEDIRLIRKSGGKSGTVSLE
ncbi:cyclic pyranopterin monophosphate synthase MoaC [Chloroflexota bacterium]